MRTRYSESHNHSGRPGGCEGFTLMEVAIAIAVIVIGVLALFALIGKGLDSANLAAEDTHTAIFADAVFNALRSRSSVAAEVGTTYWTDYWNDVRQGNVGIPLANTNIWQFELVGIPGNPFAPPVTVPTEVYADGGTYTQSLMNVPFHDTTLMDIETIALRYEVEVSFRPPDPNNVLNERVNVSLWVWGGPYGEFNRDDAIYYYSEFEDQGDL